MPVYADTYLPSKEELTVQEVNMTQAHLKAGALHVGKYCDEQSKEFMLCRNEEKDPRKCIKEGKIVTACAMEFFRKVKKLCRDEYEQYAHCIDFSSQDFAFTPCRKTQAIYDKCILEKMNFERPPLGHFSLPRIHHTERPRPTFKKHEFPDTPEELPDDYPRERAKYGSRFHFIY